MNPKVETPIEWVAPLEKFSRELAARPFQPHRMIPTGHLQTVVATQLKREFPWGWSRSEEEFVELADGARVRAFGAYQARPAPTLIALHGMGGSSDSIYMRGLSHKAYREGWNAIRLNLYDLNYKTRKPTIFHSGASGPVREIVRELIRRHGLETVFLSSVSMSGNMLLKLLGESPEETPEQVVAAAAISPLVDMTVSWQILEARSNTLYRIHFVKGLKDVLRARISYLARYIDAEALMRIRTIREFDEVFTAPLAGFRNAFEYYQKASASNWIRDVRLPTLVLHSKDDPLLPWEPLVRREAVSNPNLLIHLTERGGHVGFVEQDLVDIDRSWAENRLIDYFRSFVA